MVHTTSADVVPEMMARLEAHMTKRYPDVRPNIRLLGNGPPVEKPVQIRVSGKDDRVFQLAQEVKDKLATRTDTRNIGDDWGPRVNKLVVNVSQDRARRAGITNEDVATSLQTFLSGYEITRYRENTKTIPVVLRSVAEGRRDVGRLETLDVFSADEGTTVPLTQVANIDLEWEASEVRRRNRYRTVTVDADLIPGVTAFEVMSSLEPWLDARQEEWGAGYAYEFGGEVYESAKANASITAKLPLAGVAIIMLLVWQFNSLRKPLIVLATILLALVGVAIGLLTVRVLGLGGGYFGFMTLLGIISLAGIVINNGIVLIDRIDIEQGENGLSPPHAVIQAAQQRLRPILLTTATTVASLLPLYVGGNELWQPLAVAIMFGLVFATVLTLGFVPLLYSMFYRVHFGDFVYPEGPSDTGR
jgi:multidrug efflux pump subunit AcrB